MIKSMVFIISFLTLLIYFFIAMQFVYAQRVENEIIENTLERVEEVTQGTKEVLEKANKTDQTVVVNETSRSIIKEKEEMESSWKNYTDEHNGFTIEYP
jgi:cell shape-determining protein MreC